MVNILQISSHTRTQPSDCLLSYAAGHALERSDPSAEKQSVYSTPTDHGASEVMPKEMNKKKKPGNKGWLHCWFLWHSNLREIIIIEEEEKIRERQRVSVNDE